MSAPRYIICATTPLYDGFDAIRGSVTSPWTEMVYHNLRYTLGRARHVQTRLDGDGCSEIYISVFDIETGRTISNLAWNGQRSASLLNTEIPF